jgi:hypothetical protein
MATKARIAHTAGDWRAAVEGTSSARWISITADDYCHDDGSPHELFRSETVQTREAGAWRDVDGADVIRANVALAIAGSGLLAAAQRALDWFDRFGFESMPGSLGSELRAAIALAEGGA